MINLCPKGFTPSSVCRSIDESWDRISPEILFSSKICEYSPSWWADSHSPTCWGVKNERDLLLVVDSGNKLEEEEREGREEMDWTCFGEGGEIITGAGSLWHALNQSADLK